MGMEDRKLVLHEIHESLGGKMIPFAGYIMPVRYSSDKEEHLAVRNDVGIFDVSHMGEFTITGPNALDLIQKVTSNDASKLSPGRAQYSCLPNSDGGIVDDLIVYMNGEEDYLLVVNASNIDKDWAWIVSQNSMGAEMKNISDDLALFAVQGPKAIDTLQKMTDVDLSSIKFYHFVKGQMGGIENIIISATGYTGSGGFELYVPTERAVELWEAIMTTGQNDGIKPIGLGARDTLRMEMGYCLYGNDITDTTSPFEAGLGWITKFSKDFVNSENLLKQKEAGVSRKLVGFIMEERGIPRHGYELEDASGNSIGEVTSGTMSPSMNVGIGLGYVSNEFSMPESEIYVVIRNKKLKARVKKLPLLS